MLQEPQLSITPNVPRPAVHESSTLSKLTGFFLSRWRGEAPLAITFWRDMLCIGTALNIPAGLLGIALHVANAPVAIAMSVLFALLPWNVFLFLAVWRSSELVKPFTAYMARSLAALWLGAVMII